MAIAYNETLFTCAGQDRGPGNCRRFAHRLRGLSLGGYGYAPGYYAPGYAYAPPVGVVVGGGWWGGGWGHGGWGHGGWR